MQRARAGPDSGLRGRRLELGRHFVEELVAALALVDWRGQCEQLVHFLVRQMQRRGRIRRFSSGRRNARCI